MAIGTRNSQNLTPRDDLLDEIVRLSGCDFLSDLPQNPLLVCGALKQIRAKSFPLASWQEAARYLAGIDARFSTAEEARSALLRAIGCRRGSG